MRAAEIAKVRRSHSRALRMSRLDPGFRFAPTRGFMPPLASRA